MYTATSELYTDSHLLSLHAACPICGRREPARQGPVLPNPERHAPTVPPGMRDRPAPSPCRRHGSGSGRSPGSRRRGCAPGGPPDAAAWTGTAPPCAGRAAVRRPPPFRRGRSAPTAGNGGPTPAAPDRAATARPTAEAEGERKNGGEGKRE